MANIEAEEIRLFLEQFNAESERASVILAAAVLENELESALAACLVTARERPDELLGRARPQSTFSAKIDLAYRIGLISAHLCRDLHWVRDIRNEFAHNPTSSSLDEGRVKDLASNVLQSLRLDSPRHRLRAFVGTNTKALFTAAVGMLFVRLRILRGELAQTAERTEERMYDATRWLAPESPS